MKKACHMLRERFILLIVCFICTQMVCASIYTIGKTNDIVGKIQFTQVKRGESLDEIAQRYDVGFYELIEANPGIGLLEQPKVGTMLLIPSRYVLPKIRRKNSFYQGIVINSAEMRLYYFPEYTNTVYTYPVGIGRQGWETPTGMMKIIEKRENPWWYVPQSIRKARAREGFQLPTKVPPGPENPLGTYAMRLSRSRYLIHGTNEPSGVGRRSSSGCIRMYPEDIKQLYAIVHVNTSVKIINQPYKFGWFHHILYLEAHEPLQETLAAFDMHDLKQLAIMHGVKTHPMTYVNWQKVEQIGQQHTGIPEPVGRTRRTH